ncbi:hypothetical protein P7C71_g4764, partial [Lecanoromycetidae sp. Uapishka_2]
MHLSIASSAIAAFMLFANYIQARAVGTISEDHAHQDIDDAMAMGLDGFALNIGDPRSSFVSTSLSDLFGYAAYRGFKLFISMDLSGDGSGYGIIWGTLLAWKASFASKMYFVPDFDETQGYYDAAAGNDGPESHYIGNLWPEANTNPQGLLYASQTSYPHTAWQPLITSFIQAWKAGGSPSSMSPPSGTAAIGVLWYKTILQAAVCNGDTKPQGFENGRDALNWAIVLPAGSSGMQVRLTSNGNVLQTIGVNSGLNYGSPAGVQAGDQMLELLDAGGHVIMTANNGSSVSSGCPDGIYNMNYQVVGLS